MAIGTTTTEPIKTEPNQTGPVKTKPIKTKPIITKPIDSEGIFETTKIEIVPIEKLRYSASYGYRSSVGTVLNKKEKESKRKKDRNRPY